MLSENIELILQKSSSDYQTAIEFANKMAEHWYHCYPSDIPQRIFIAKANNQIVTTVGVTEINSASLALFPLSNLYEIDAKNLPNDWNWEKVVQLSWFFNIKKGYFSPVLLKALRFCQDINKHYAILQMKENIFQILSKKGVKFIQINNARLKHDNLSEKSKAYYLEQTPIRLYYLNIPENILSIQKYITNNSY